MALCSPRLLLVAGLLADAALAQDLIRLVSEGDPVPGVGAVTTIEAVRVNDQGEWLVEADTDHPDPSRDGVILKSGVLFAREGEALAAPPGTAIGSFGAIQIDDAGDVSWDLLLSGASPATSSCLFLNKTLLSQQGDTPPITGLSAGTPIGFIHNTKSESAGTSLILANVDDPAIPSSVDQALILVTGTSPGSLSMGLVAKEGDLLPGLTETIRAFPLGPHDIALSDGGHVMLSVLLDGVDILADEAVFLGSTLLAQEGSPSPIAGRDWASLANSVVDVNDAGSYVFTGLLQGDSSSNDLIVKDGAKFRQQGDSLQAIAPFTLDSFGVGPVYVSNSDTVLWFGDWNAPNFLVDTGLFLDDELLIQEGVTQVDDLTVQRVGGIGDGYHLSADGRYIVAEVELAGGIEAAVLIDLGYGTLQPMSDCTSPVGTLTWTAGAPVIGSSFELTLDQAQGSGAFPFAAFATQPVLGHPPCGLVVPGIGELLIDFHAPNPILILPGASTTGAPTVIAVPVPLDTTLPGSPFFVQGLFADPLALTGEPFRLTNGLVAILGL